MMFFAILIDLSLYSFVFLQILGSYLKKIARTYIPINHVIMTLTIPFPQKKHIDVINKIVKKKLLWNFNFSCYILFLVSDIINVDLHKKFFFLLLHFRLQPFHFMLVISRFMCTISLKSCASLKCFGYILQNFISHIHTSKKIISIYHYWYNQPYEFGYIFNNIF